MLKRTSKKLAVMLVLSMLATMFVGVGVASADGSIGKLSTPTVSDGVKAQALGTIKVTVDGGAIKQYDSVIFKLPSDFDFGDSHFSTTVYNATTSAAKNYIMVPAKINANDANTLDPTLFKVDVLDADDEVKLVYNGTQGTDGDGVFYIYLNDIDVEDGSDADCNVTFDGPTNSGFPQGSVLVGKASSTGDVTLTTSGKKTSDNTFDFTLRIKESTAGALEIDNETIKLELPDGFKWTSSGAATINKIWGQDIALTLNPDDEDLKIQFAGPKTTVASCWEIKLAFDVDDDDDCELGVIKAKVTGDTDSDLSEIEVGTYGDYAASITTENVPTLIAGQDEQEIADIIIKESMEKSLSKDRTVIITLPDEAVWQPVLKDYVDNKSKHVSPAGLDAFDTDKGLKIGFNKYTDDYRAAKFTIDAQSGDDEAEVKLKDVEVAIEAGFTGDLVATVTGSAGISGEITLAKVVAPMSATAEKAPNVVIGKSGQAAADYTITENVAGAFVDDGTVVLDLPAGVTFTGTPDVEVTEGNLKISNIRRQNSDNEVAFKVDNDSSTPSTVKVSGIKLKLDRTVAEGGITLKVKGDGAVETAVYEDWTNSTSAAGATIANVATAAGEGDAVAKSAFVIGSTTYTVNGVENTMDVAPYISNGRTYMPIRYIANAMGISDSNILWDAATQTVTLMKGDKVVQMKIGSTNIVINGAAVTMDAAPEITNSRTMLPARYVAQAFGATVTWDETTQTVGLQ